MELQVKEREGATKKEAKRLRREGQIPAIVYPAGGAKEARKISVSRDEFEAALRKIEKGALSTTLLTLKTDKGDHKVICKDIQYHVTTYEILHLDLLELNDNVRVNVNVPLRFIGGSKSPGVKLGGVVREVIRKLRVQCLPKDIPGQLTLNISKLEIGQTLRLRDIEMPAGVEPKAKMDEVAVVIAKR